MQNLYHKKLCCFGKLYSASEGIWEFSKMKSGVTQRLILNPDLYIKVQVVWHASYYSVPTLMHQKRWYSCLFPAKFVS